MQPWVFLSFFVIVVGLPVVVGVSAGMFQRWLKHKEVMAQALGTQSVQNAAENTIKLDRLEKRMVVMERILTDRSTQLGEEIERLRDAPIN